MVWLVRGTYVMSRVLAGVSGEVAERERGGRGEEEERKRRGRGEEEERKRRGRGEGEEGKRERERKRRGRAEEGCRASCFPASRRTARLSVASVFQGTG